MSPNSRFSPTISPNQCMKMYKTNGQTLDTSNYVPMERLLEVAWLLAELELSSNQFVDRCVSLLDTTYDLNHNLMIDCNESVDKSMDKSMDKSVDKSLVDKNDKNYCEVVSVPTSTHVAQIVGKQGAKIKSLRAKSRTYIQTPVSGEEPVFIITGRREDVLKVKSEILSVSDHFSTINVERQRKFKENADIPGSISMTLIIPSFLIGLIVGRNGNTIRNIQKITQTYIETPKILENSSFTITGVECNVLSAIEWIVSHVKTKTNRKFKTVVLPNGDIKLNFDK